MLLCSLHFVMAVLSFTMVSFPVVNQVFVIVDLSVLLSIDLKKSKPIPLAMARGTYV